MGPSVNKTPWVPCSFYGEGRETPLSYQPVLCEALERGEQGACCACHTRGSAPCTVGAAGFAVGWWPVHKTVSGGSQMSWGSGPQVSTPEASSCSPVRGDRSVCHTSPAMSVPPEREFPCHHAASACPLTQTLLSWPWGHVLEQPFW